MFSQYPTNNYGRDLFYAQLTKLNLQIKKQKEIKQKKLTNRVKHVTGLKILHGITLGRAIFCTLQTLRP